MHLPGKPRSLTKGLRLLGSSLPIPGALSGRLAKGTVGRAEAPGGRRQQRVEACGGFKAALAGSEKRKAGRKHHSWSCMADATG